MKNNYKVLLIPVALLALASCAPNTNPTIDQSSSDSMTSYLPEIEVVDIKSAIEKIQTVNSFQLKVKDKDGFVINNKIFNKNYIWDELNKDGYVFKNNAVYPVSLVNQKVKNKEVLDNPSLYGKDGVSFSFADIDISGIADGKQSFDTLKQKIALPLLDMCGYDESAYTSLNKVNLALSEDKSELNINFFINRVEPGEGIKEYVETSIVSRIGQAKVPFIEDYIENGEIYQLDSTLTKIRELFYADNYTQIQRGLENEITQVDYFHPSYYTCLYSDSFIAQEPLLKARQVAHLEILRPDQQLDLLKDNQGNSYPLIYDDTFHFLYDGSYDTPGDLILITRPNPVRQGYAQGAFTEVIKDIAKAWHYPKALKMWTNLDEFDAGSANLYYTNSTYLINNYLDDMGLTGAFDNNGGISQLQLMIERGSNESIDSVTFRLMTPANQSYDIEYTDFGKTVFQPFEDYLADLDSHVI